MKKIIIRTACYLIGLIILSSGIALTIKSDLGTGGWDALNVGLSENVGLTVGSWVIIAGLVIILLNAYLLKQRPDFPAILTILVLGLLVDLWLLHVLVHWLPGTFMEQFLGLIIGVLLLAFGIAIYIQAQFARTPVDALMVVVQKRTGLSLQLSRTLCEITSVILAFIAGGPIGIGTIIITLFIGPIVQLMYFPLERLLKSTS